MSNRPRPASVHYYVDADLLGVGKILAQLRPDVTYPGDPGGPVKGSRVRAACTITDPATPDEIWIQETARQEWLIITRDRHIQDHRAEIEAVRSSGARMVNLAADDAIDRFSQLEVIMCQWRRISALLDENGPFIYSVTRTTMRPLDLATP
jgi:PIN like domain